MSLKVSPSKSWGKNVISQNTLSGSSQWKYAWICSGLLPPFQTVDSEPDACRRLPCNSAFAISSPSPVIASTKVQDDARTLRTSMAPDVEMHSAKLISLHEPSQSRRAVSTRHRVSSSMFIRIVVWTGRSASGRLPSLAGCVPKQTFQHSSGTRGRQRLCVWVSYQERMDGLFRHVDQNRSTAVPTRDLEQRTL